MLAVGLKNPKELVEIVQNLQKLVKHKELIKHKVSEIEKMCELIHRALTEIDELTAESISDICTDKPAE